MTVTDLLRLDATALALIGHDVALITDSALTEPTPCQGWTVALQTVGPTLDLPSRGPVSTEWVLGVHTVDMLVHRWDLARALQTPLTVPAALAETVLPLARANTAPGSPLNQPGGAYRPPFDGDPTDSVMDAIVALLGRDPRWAPPGHQ